MSDRDIIMNDQVTIRLPNTLISQLDAAVEDGQFPNRSEAVREGTRQVLESADYGFEQGQEGD